MVIGITGSFGTGKTTVAKIFKSFGAKIIDADKIAHSLIKPKTMIYKKIIDTFGKDILKKNKTVDRKNLAKFVFNNKNLLKRFNGIMHPQILKIIKEKIKNYKDKIIVLDAPLLIETGLHKIVDKLVVVKTNRETQIRRIQNKFSLTKDEILKRISSQIPLREKIRLADFVIDNSGTIKNTKKQAEQIRRLLWKN